MDYITQKKIGTKNQGKMNGWDSIAIHYFESESNDLRLLFLKIRN